MNDGDFYPESQPIQFSVPSLKTKYVKNECLRSRHLRMAGCKESFENLEVKEIVYRILVCSQSISQMSDNFNGRIQTGNC